SSSTTRILPALNFGDLCPFAPCAYGQGKIEYRAVPRFAFYPDFFAVRLHNSFGNRQPHAGSFRLESVLPPAKEFIEDAAALVFLDARTAVRDSDHDSLTLQLGGDDDGRSVGRILQGILQ